MSNCLKLYGDKSIAVRILLSEILPDLRDKMQIKDKANISTVDIIIEQLINDKCSAVRDAISISKKII